MLPPVPHNTPFKDVKTERISQPWLQWLELLRNELNANTSSGDVHLHTALTDVAPNQHHNQTHTHHDDGSGTVSYDDLSDLPTAPPVHDNESHITEGFPSPSVPSDATDQGTSESVARLDHVHQREVWVENEVPSGVIDGSNDTFMLFFSPSPPLSLSLYFNGLHLQGSGIDYTLVGNIITMVTEQIPQTDDTLLAHYRYV